MLLFSFVGMKTREVKVEGSSPIDIKLEAENQALDEVVVVGYGVQRKEALTGGHDYG